MAGEYDEENQRFKPEELARSILASPLLAGIEKAGEKELLPVVIDLNFKFLDGLAGARTATIELIKIGAERIGAEAMINEQKIDISEQYLFADLTPDLIRELARLNLYTRESLPEVVPLTKRPIFMIWPDFEVRALANKSVATVKADAAHRAFSALGEGVVWAVLDSGIDGKHLHFERHGNLELHQLDPPLQHEDFTGDGGFHADPLVDDNGHGTHVAGIIAGEAGDPNATEAKLSAASLHRNEQGNYDFDRYSIKHISGMAPRSKLVSFKILNEKGRGPVSNILAAIARIQKINENGRWIKIHGVNLSVGYDFEPEWFACGQSPLCVEVNRLVKSGVVVVTASGNTGFGYEDTHARGTVASGLLMSINDPGNADLAITVGSTHRDMPHIYGVSYFSSKGPTGDGRLKPDLVAPGEKIVSCATGKKRQQAASGGELQYVEDSGTSMAAPHVSGVIAAFLSVRREFVGRPEKVKELFMNSATDLKRERYMQGHGLVDLMRAIQSV